MEKKIKSITDKAVGKTATSETRRRTWRTALQVFLSVFLAGLATVIMDWGTPAFKMGFFSLLATALGAAFGAIMNLEDAAPGDAEEGDEE